jgi:hypothetical protein
MIKTERLSRLATLLENGTAESMGLKFNLYNWSETGEKRGGFLWLKKTRCHTAACAIGMACLSGEFDADNLEFELWGDTFIPLYAGNRGWSAVMEFFGLTDKQSFHLFSQKRYDGPTAGPQAEKNVAKRIRAFIKSNSNSKPTKKAVDKIKREALSTARAATATVTEQVKA